MRLAVLFLGLFGAAFAGGAEDLRPMLDRLSEEAAAFRSLAPKLIGQEALQQLARRQSRRFRPRVGAGAYQPPPIKEYNKEIVSEYGFTALRESPDSLVEIREVVAVDGKQVREKERARERLALSLQSDNDATKKKLLSEFARHGLRGAATDFGQIILLFRRHVIDNYEFRLIREANLGPHQVVVLSYEQRQGPEALTVFSGDETRRLSVGGEIWLRRPDWAPLVITLESRVSEEGHITAHRGVVEYYESAYGLMLPVNMRYEKLYDGEPTLRLSADYSAFQMFDVQTEIKFTPVAPTGAPAAGPPPGRH